MAYVGAVMTLPGIAGFVLTMGIGVDSNVLIFERIKEELEAQRGVRASINAGFNRVFWTLFDTHIAALDLGGVPVPVRHRADPRLRGDAVLRSGVEPVHVDLRVEDALRAARWARARRQRRATLMPILAVMHIFKDTQLRLPALALARDRAVVGHHHRRRGRRSWTKGIPLGIEFAGGTAVIVEVRAAAERAAGARRDGSIVPGGGENVDRPDLRRSGAAPGDDSRAARRRGAGHLAQLGRSSR